MYQKSISHTLDLLLIFGFILLSNISAFLSVIWLIPNLILLEFVVWFMLILVTIWKLIKDNMVSDFVESLKRNWIIFPFLVFSGFSIFWSVYWEISLYRWLMLLFTVIVGGFIGLKYEPKKIIDILSIFGMFILIFGAILIVFVPHLGVMNYYVIQGAWRGIYWHKNHMGLIATFINILFVIGMIYSVKSKEKKVFFWGTFYIFSMLFVVQSDSVASYFTTIFLYGVILLALFLQRFGKKLRRFHYLLFLVILIISSTVLFSNLDFVFGIFNRNTSLTGRIPMWTHLYNTYISERPVGGYGFNAFWYLAAHRVAMQKAVGYGDPIVIADNGFIDILVNTGFIGLILFLLFYLGGLWHTIKYVTKTKGIIGIFPLIVMLYVLIANISWSLIFENEGFFMLIMISILFNITRNTPTAHRAQ